MHSSECLTLFSRGFQIDLGALETITTNVMRNYEHSWCRTSFARHLFYSEMRDFFQSP